MVYLSLLKGKVFGLFLSILVSLLFYPLVGYSAVFNVTNEAELREALSIAESNGEDDVINIGAGLYRTFGEPFIYNDVGGDRRALTIQGEGKGITILDGEETSRVLYIRTPKDTFNMVTIKDLTVRNGFIEDFLEDGAGIQVTAQTFIAEDCEFANNKSEERAGGISINAIDVSLENNMFINNSAFGSAGGGAVISGTNINLANNSFAENVSDWRGGGIRIGGDNVTLVGNSFINNTAGSGGGADIGGSSSAVITDNEFLNNNCASYGGGLSVWSSNLTITNNRFIENSARLGGGGADITSDGDATLSGNIFTGNSVFLLPTEPDGGGGGACIYIKDQDEIDVVLTNNIFTQNTSTRNGGALDVEFLDCINQSVEQVSPGPRTTSIPTCPPTSEDNLVLTNNTFTLNSSELNGGAISIMEEISKDNTANIYNNIVYENMANGEGDDIYIKGGLVTTNIRLKINLFNNDYSDLFITCVNSNGCLPELNEGNNIDEDPLFADAEVGDVSLRRNSPCIDAGDPNAPDVPDTDIFGNPRVPPPDMGAVEYIVQAAKGGGCSIAHTPVTSCLAVFLALPVLILLRRIVKRYRS